MKCPRLLLVSVGYVRATSDQQQLWHHDLPLELQSVGVEHMFSCFTPVNVDCPVDSRENMLVYGSGSGVPHPWQEIWVGMLSGDLSILSSYVIHRGGVVPTEAPGGSIDIITFAGIVTRRVDYETTVPIIPPPWANSPAQPPSSPRLPKSCHCTTAQCNHR